MKEVCRDVRVEPQLLPDYRTNATGNTADRARLDVSARGLWSRCEKTYFDIRITHPLSPTYSQKTRVEIYQLHENEKKRKYNERIVQVEKATFNPLVFTTSGDWQK